MIKLTFTNEHLLAQTVPIFEHLARNEDAPAHAHLAHQETDVPELAEIVTAGAANTRLLSGLVVLILSVFRAQQWSACTSILTAIYNQHPGDCLLMLVPQLYAAAITRQPALQAGGSSLGDASEKVRRDAPAEPALVAQQLTIAAPAVRRAARGWLVGRRW